MPTLDDLTPRQREVALLVARGHAYKHVAAMIARSVRTVEWVVEEIVHRLDADPLTGTDDARQLAPRQRIMVWVVAEQHAAEARKEAA